MEKNRLIKNFRIVSYAIGGIFFVVMGIKGFIQIAGTEGTPPVGLFIFTVLITSFGIWSIRSYLKNHRDLN